MMPAQIPSQMPPINNVFAARFGGARPGGPVGGPVMSAPIERMRAMGPAQAMPVAPMQNNMAARVLPGAGMMAPESNAVLANGGLPIQAPMPGQPMPGQPMTPQQQMQQPIEAPQNFMRQRMMMY